MLWIPSSSTGKFLWASIVLLFFIPILHAQGLSVNTTGNSPDPSAMLDVSATDKGLLMPRMTSSQRVNISSPADGLMVFDTDRATPYSHFGGQWSQLVPIPTGSMLWRTDRQDALMDGAGFSYFTQQLIPNGISTRSWRQPAPTITSAPSARQNPISVWTGTEMLIWGGSNPVQVFDGGRYNPDTDAWSSVSSSNAPTEIGFGWTSSGDALYVFGGSFGAFQSNIGYIYDWASDTWGLMGQVGGPSARSQAGMTWTGQEVCVWGGVETVVFTNTYLNTGYLYNPVSQTWTAMSTTAAPVGRQAPMVHYDGNKIVVWGGSANFAPLTDGGIYDPLTDSWTLIPTDPVLANLVGSIQAFIIDDQLIVFGISSGSTIEGGIYNFATQSWTAANMTGAPSVRVEYTLIWTGKTLTIWGGRNGGTYYNDGGVFDPATNSWTTFNPANAPSARTRAGACWTGEGMLLFGGITTGNSYLQDPAFLESPGYDTYYLYRKN